MALAHSVLMLVAAILLSAPFELSSAQLLCNKFTVADLGSTTTITDDVGLLPTAASPPSAQTVIPIPVMVQDYNIVCDATGSMRNTSSYVSIVVQFVCQVEAASRVDTLADCDGSTSIIRQYQFRCAMDTNVWELSNLGNGVQTLLPTATLNTTLKDRCVSCVDDEQSFIDSVTHCSSCPSNIMCNEGQRRCYQGQFVDECCNYYVNNTCVVTCPNPLMGDGTTFDCGCGQLNLANGMVSYTNRYTVGSMATHTCGTGYRRAGDATRTCTDSGWDGQTITCEFIQCPDLSIENGAVAIDSVNRGVNSKATYTCDSDYQLQNGDRERNCLADGSWDGTAPKCNKKTSLSPGAIAGIAIAGFIVLVALITTVIVVTVVIFKKKSHPKSGRV